MQQIPRYLLKIVLLATLSLSACTSEDKDPRRDKPLVQVMSIPKAKTPEQAFTGVIAARVQSNLGFRISGKVVERFVNMGQTIKKGQPLMRIDRNDLALAVTAKEKNVAAVKAHAMQAIANETRYKALSRSSAASRQTYEQTKATADSARAQLAAAEAQAKIAKNEESYSLLLADSDGTVVEILAEPGQVVRVGQTVVKFAHAGSREAVVDLPETVRPSLGSTAKAILYGNIAHARAHLRQLSDSADPKTRTFEARYILEGNMAQAPLGATVTVFIPVKGAKSIVEVPLSAVTDGGKGPGVWVLNNKELSVFFHLVQIISLTEETVILKNDFSAKGKIVALGAHLLHEGEKVSIADYMELQ